MVDRRPWRKVGRYPAQSDFLSISATAPTSRGTKHQENKDRHPIHICNSDGKGKFKIEAKNAFQSVSPTIVLPFQAHKLQQIDAIWFKSSLFYRRESRISYDLFYIK